MTGKLCDCADFLLATRSTYMKNAVATMRFQIQKIVMVGLTTLTTSRRQDCFLETSKMHLKRETAADLNVCGGL